ncbi:MAG TPA: hypothetical protein VED01_22230 [Burkholderiales bacterium]|nr:hypothetical protein [Burkholderiales bacterium]
MSRRGSDLLYAWIAATLLSGIPSTVHALVTGGDPLEATRAAGAMLAPAQSALPKLLLAAALVHATVSLFWAAVLLAVLPRRHVVLWAILAAALIGVLDLRIIAPVFFPEVAALSFWPQFADHVMWGACIGVTLAFRYKRRETGVRDQG